MNEPAFLYIEDDPASQTVVSVLITRIMGYPNLAVIASTEGIEHWLQSLVPTPDVVLIDIRIKPLDGYQVLKIIRQNSRYAASKVIALTAHVMAYDIENLKAAGFDGLIGKPVDDDEFPQLIKAILAGKSIWYVP